MPRGGRAGGRGRGRGRGAKLRSNIDDAVQAALAAFGAQSDSSDDGAGPSRLTLDQRMNIAGDAGKKVEPGVRKPKAAGKAKGAPPEDNKPKRPASPDPDEGEPTIEKSVEFPTKQRRERVAAPPKVRRKMGPKVDVKTGFAAEGGDAGNEEGTPEKRTIFRTVGGNEKPGAKSGQGHGGEDSDADLQWDETDADAWAARLKGLQDKGVDDLRTSFSLKECSLRGLRAHLFFRGLCPQEGGMPLHDEEGKVNLHFLLSTYSAARKLRKKRREGNDTLDEVPDADYLHLKWLVRQAVELQAVDLGEVRRGKISGKRMDAIRKSGMYSLRLARNLARKDKAGAAEQAVVEEPKFKEHVVTKDDEEIEKHRQRLRERASNVKGEIGVQSSHDVDLQQMQEALMAPTLTFDWEQGAEEEDDGVTHTWGGLEVEAPDNGQPQSRRDLFKDHLRRSMSFNQAKSLAVGRASSADSILRKPSFDLSLSHTTTVTSEILQSNAKDLQRVLASDKAEDDAPGVSLANAAVSTAADMAISSNAAKVAVPLTRPNSALLARLQQQQRQKEDEEEVKQTIEADVSSGETRSSFLQVTSVLASAAQSADGGLQPVGGPGTTPTATASGAIVAASEAGVGRDAPSTLAGDARMSGSLEARLAPEASEVGPTLLVEKPDFRGPGCAISATATGDEHMCDISPTAPMPQLGPRGVATEDTMCEISPTAPMVQPGLLTAKIDKMPDSLGLAAAIDDKMDAISPTAPMVVNVNACEISPTAPMVAAKDQKIPETRLTSLVGQQDSVGMAAASNDKMCAISPTAPMVDVNDQAGLKVGRLPKVSPLATPKEDISPTAPMPALGVELTSASAPLAHAAGGARPQSGRAQELQCTSSVWKRSAEQAFKSGPDSDSDKDINAEEHSDLLMPDSSQRITLVPECASEDRLRQEQQWRKQRRMAMRQKEQAQQVSIQQLEKARVRQQAAEKLGTSMMSEEERRRYIELVGDGPAGLVGPPPLGGGHVAGKSVPGDQRADPALGSRKSFQRGFHQLLMGVAG